MTKKGTLTRIVATMLAIITAAHAFSFASSAAQEEGGAAAYKGSEAVCYTELSEAWDDAAFSGKETRLILR